jgi:hypothetical protein
MLYQFKVFRIHYRKNECFYYDVSEAIKFIGQSVGDITISTIIADMCQFIESRNTAKFVKRRIIQSYYRFIQQNENYLTSHTI